MPLKVIWNTNLIGANKLNSDIIKKKQEWATIGGNLWGSISQVTRCVVVLLQNGGYAIIVHCIVNELQQALNH